MVPLVIVLVSLLLVDSSSAVFTPLPNAVWSGRQRHASWTDGASIFIAGGVGSGGVANTVYTSADGGLTWKGAGFAVPYAEGQAAASFQGVQYVLGGRNGGVDSKTVTTWSPTSGTANTVGPWSARAFAMAAVWTPPPATALPSQLLLIGGSQFGMSYLNDVWSYRPTSGWTSLGNGAFPPVSSAGVASIQKGSQIILAGGAYSNAGPSYVYNTVWVGHYSGVTSQLAWSLRCSAAPWSARTMSLTATSNDYLYMIEGASQVPVTVSNDVWSSVDGGYTWIRLAAADSFPARVGAALVAVNRQLVLTGGADLSTHYNDVWQAWVE